MRKLIFAACAALTALTMQAQQWEPLAHLFGQIKYQYWGGSAIATKTVVWLINDVPISKIRLATDNADYWFDFSDTPGGENIGYVDKKKIKYYDKERADVKLNTLPTVDGKWYEYEFATPVYLKHVYRISEREAEIFIPQDLYGKYLAKSTACNLLWEQFPSSSRDFVLDYNGSMSADNFAHDLIRRHIYRNSESEKDADESLVNTVVSLFMDSVLTINDPHHPYHFHPDIFIRYNASYLDAQKIINNAGEIVANNQTKGKGFTYTIKDDRLFVSHPNLQMASQAMFQKFNGKWYYAQETDTITDVQTMGLLEYKIFYTRGDWAEVKRGAEVTAFRVHRTIDGKPCIFDMRTVKDRTENDIMGEQIYHATFPDGTVFTTNIFYNSFEGDNLFHCGEDLGTHGSRDAELLLKKNLRAVNVDITYADGTKDRLHDGKSDLQEKKEHDELMAKLWKEFNDVIDRFSKRYERRYVTSIFNDCVILEGTPFNLVKEIIEFYRGQGRYTIFEQYRPSVRDMMNWGNDISIYKGTCPSFAAKFVVKKGRVYKVIETYTNWPGMMGG